MKKTKLKILIAVILGFAFLGSAFSADLNRKEEDAFYVAAKAYEDGFYDVALTLFDRFLRTYTDTDKKAEVLIYVGQCYYFQEKYLKALDQFETLYKAAGTEKFRDKILFWLGEIYTKGRDYKQAAEFYQELIKNYKDSSFVLSAYKSLAQVLTSEGKFDEAITAYREILAQFKDSAIAGEASFGICESLYRKKDLPGAKKELEDFISRYPDSSSLNRAYFYLGETDYYLGDFNSAVDAYGKARATTTDEAQAAVARLGMGWAYLKLKKYDDAEKIFAIFPIEEVPLGVTLGRAVLRAGTGDTVQALDLFEKVIVDDKTGEFAPLAHFGKGEVLYSLSRYDEAVVAYRVSLDKLKIFSGIFTETRELRDKIYYGMAWSYLKIGDFRSAQEAFQKVALLSTDKIIKLSALCQLGDAYQDSGEFKKAIETYQGILQNYSESAYNDYVGYQLGMTWLKMQNLDSAILAFRKLSKDYPSSKLIDDCDYFVGVAYFQKGDFSAAKEQLALFSVTFKDSSYRAQALFLLGESLVNLSEYKAAVDAFNIVVREYFDQETLRQKAEYEIANAYAQMGNEAEANKRLSDFIARYPDSQMSPDIIFWLGQSFLQKDDYPNARKYFERLIRNYPDHELLPEASVDIGISYLKENNDEAALRSFEFAKTQGAGVTADRASLLAGDVYRARSDFEGALKNYKLVAQGATGMAKSAYLKMAEVYGRKASFQEAIDVLENALSIGNAQENADIQLKIAGLYEEMARPDKALEAYTKVFYLYPSDQARSVKALLSAARIYENKEDGRNLESVLRKITEYPVPEAKYAKEKLLWLKESRFKR
jgi:TolA-binding protein